MLRVPRDRLLLTGDVFSSALVTHTRCFMILEVIGSTVVLVAACLTRCLLKEGARHPSERQAITPAKYGEETLALNQMLQ